MRDQASLGDSKVSSPRRWSQARTHIGGGGKWHRGISGTLTPALSALGSLREASTGGYLLIAIPGEAQNDSLYFSGNSVGVKPKSGARKVLAQLLENGAEHHFAVGYNVFAEDIELLGQRLKIPVKVY